MIHSVRAFLGILATLAALAAPAFTEARASAGRKLEYREIAAQGLPPQRLTIWLPPGYDAPAMRGRRFGVIYMQDGHNLFDLANSNFNKIWAADRAMEQVTRQGIAPYIIVGIWAPGADRFREYLPRPAYDAAPPALRTRMDAMARGPVVSDRYLGWIVGVLKPWVDSRFRTLADRDHTAAIGSSMGGLMSCYAIVEHPETFGRAACMSSHWPAADPSTVSGHDPQAASVWTQYFGAHLGAPDGRRIWMDHGDATLDAYYAPYQQRIDEAFTGAGWRRNVDFRSEVFPGEAHDENAWASRLPEVLRWLLRDPSDAKSVEIAP